MENQRVKPGQYLSRLLIVMGLIVLVTLLLYPSVLKGGDPIRIEHQSQREGVTSGVDDPVLRSLNDQQDSVQSEVQQRQWELNQAYVPSGPLQEPSRQANITRAQNALDNAKSQLNSIQNQMYLHKRVQESQERDQRLEEQRR